LDVPMPGLLTLPQACPRRTHRVHPRPTEAAPGTPATRAVS
jgi:hypothetical protein